MSNAQAGETGPNIRDERRAVIDIGSNTVRLVIYGGPPRAPEVLWNEKVSPRLGRDLEKTGEMPAAAMEEALSALARYAVIIRDHGIARVEAVATAAPRDAANGGAFILRVRDLGLDVRLLSGEEEACASAWGAIGAFPGAQGVVADLGGGSLELVAVDRGGCGAAASLPIGTLRLPALRAAGRLERGLAKLLDGAGPDIAARDGQPLYMIGGTWRAFATYAMRRMDHPLTDPHGFTLPVREAGDLARQLRTAEPTELGKLRGVSMMRAEKLPDAAALLLALLDHLRPDRLIFSSWGLREGLHFQRLDPEERAADPLLAGVAAFASERAAYAAEAELLTDWTAAADPSDGRRAANIRFAAAQLAAALRRVEPNLRTAHALEWALDKRWVGIDFAGRAMLGAALRGSLGRTEPHERLSPLAAQDELRDATAWGLAFRLAQRLGAGAASTLAAAELSVRNNELVLSIDPAHAALATGLVGKDLKALASWLGLQARLVAES